MAGVHAMSPQQTSDWCSSLALCGVRGQMLRDLQDQIVRRQIDGCLFDKMLRSNSLKDLGIEELNPRLMLAIRRSWTTDFGAVSFIDYEASQAHYRGQMEQPQTQQQQAPKQEPKDADPGSSYRPRANMQSTKKPEYSRFARDDFNNNGRCDPHDPRDPRDARAPGHLADARGAPSMACGDHWDQTGTRGGADHHRHHYGPQSNIPDNPNDLFGVRSGIADEHAQESFHHRPGGALEHPQDFFASRPRGGDHCVPFGADGPPHAPSWGGGGYQRRGPAHGGVGAGRGTELDEGFMQQQWSGGPCAAHGRLDPREREPYPEGQLGGYPSQSPGIMNSACIPPRGRGTRTPALSSSNGSLAPSYSHGPDVHMQGPPQMPQQLDGRAAQTRPRYNPGGSTGSAGWENCSFDEAVAQRRQGPVMYDTPDMSYEVVRNPHRGNANGQMNLEAWGGGLEACMPPRSRIPVNVAQAYAEVADPPRAAEAEAPRDAQICNSRDDQDGPSMRREAKARSPAIQWDADAEWGGMSLGDALAPKKAQERGGRRMADTESNRPSSAASGGCNFDDEVAVPSRSPHLDFSGAGSATSTRSAVRQTPPGGMLVDDDGWGGQSLADIVVPKKTSAQPPRASGGGGGSCGSRTRNSPNSAHAPAASTSAGAENCGKTSDEIISWVRSLPESHVPEASREKIAAIIEDERYTGRNFTNFVKSVPPEVCAPKHAMKLKAAWNNVLKEEEAKQVARANLENNNKQKGAVMVV